MMSFSTWSISYCLQLVSIFALINQPIFGFLSHHHKYMETLADFLELCDIYISIVIGPKLT